MGSIGAYRREIYMQPGYLADAAQGMPPALSEAEQKKSLFAGSGDSMAAAMLAEYFSDGRSRAVDPSDIIRNRRLADSRRLYLVSISGNTVANIRAARMSGDSVAVTSRPLSRLAGAAGSVIRLDFPHAGVTTSGSISFTSSALACISLAGGLGGGWNPAGRRGELSRIFGGAEHDACRLKVTGSLYVLGNLLTYPLAMYTAAKFYEVLGYDARYARIEQFSHMELFSAHPGDSVLILEEPNRRTRALTAALSDAGIRASVPAGIPGGGEAVRQVLYCAFLAQLLTLRLAEVMNRTECHFVTSGSLRGASNAMIY